MIYGHPAPCLVTRLRRGAVMVEPLRFISLSELGLPGGSHLGQSGAAGPYAAPGEQMRAVSAPRRSGRRGSLPVLSEHHFIG